MSDPELEAKRRQRANRKRNGLSLEDCLDEFNEADAWYCPRCKKHRIASKKFELWKALDILVIHLKRFSRNLRDKLGSSRLSKRRQRLNRKRNGLSLEDCLDEFNEAEVLSEADAWYCPRCKEHRRASKKFELWKAPDILVIHLKRFSRSLRDKLGSIRLSGGRT